MKFILIILFGFSSLSNASAESLKIQNSEKHLDALIRKTTASLGKYIGACLYPGNICSIPNQQIATAMNDMFDIAKRLTQFPVALWEQEANGIFDHGVGAHRLAVTGYTRGSKIYINKDLAINKLTGEIIAEEDMVSILIHELAHHAGFTDKDERVPDKIASMVKKRFLQLNEKITLESIGLKHISISIFNTTTLPHLLSFPITEYRSMDLLSILGSGSEIFETMMRTDSNNPAYTHTLMNEIVNTHPKNCSSYKKIHGILGSNLRWKEIPSSNNNNVVAAIDLTFYCGDNIATSKEFKAEYNFFGKLTKTNNFYDIIDAGWRIKNDRDYSHQDGKINIINLKVNTNKIVGGGTWEGSLKVEIKNNKEINKCWPLVTAKHFTPYSDGTTHELSKPDCKFKKLNGNFWEVKFKWPIASNVKSSKVYLSRMLFNLKDKDGKEETALAYPQFRQTLEIENDTNESLYKIESVSVFNDSSRVVNSLNYNEYDFFKREIIFQIIFSSCYEDLLFSRMHLEFFYFNKNTKVGMSFYEVSLEKTMYNAPEPTILNTACIEGKKILQFGFPVNYGGNLNHILRYLKTNNAQTINIGNLGFTTEDHRVFKYDLNNFNLVLPDWN
jgi:hypothetical protein